MQLAYKMGDGVRIEGLGTSNRRVTVAAAVAARSCCKKDIAMRWTLSAVAAESSYLGQHSNKMAQMKTLRDSFSQSYMETLIPWEDTLYSEDPRAVTLDHLPYLVTASNDPEVGLDLDYFLCQATWKYHQDKTLWTHQSCPYDEEPLEKIVVVDDEHDRLVGFDTADATVSVASHIVVEVQVGPKSHLVAAKIESAYESARMMHAVDTAVSYACLYFVRHNHGTLEHRDTSCARDVNSGWHQPSILRIVEHFEFGVVVRLKPSENSFSMSAVAAVAAAVLRWIVLVYSAWLT
mmetsp:Transcript_20307/g.50502  ORF Transcript_20307/g.50502 Transcript_20307/m.50502 type:complete len:292 (-) Transcript_20307:1304-2179(-)